MVCVARPRANHVPTLHDDDPLLDVRTVVVGRVAPECQVRAVDKRAIRIFKLYERFLSL